MKLYDFNVNRVKVWETLIKIYIWERGDGILEKEDPKTGFESNSDPNFLCDLFLSHWMSLDLRVLTYHLGRLELLLDPQFCPSSQTLWICDCPQGLLIISKKSAFSLDYRLFWREIMSGTSLTDGLTLKIILKFSIVQKDIKCKGNKFFLWRKYCFTFFLLKFNSLNSTSLPRRKWGKKTRSKDKNLRI